MRAPVTALVSRPGRGVHRHLRIHGRLVQHPQIALCSGIPEPQRIRTQGHSSNALRRPEGKSRAGRLRAFPDRSTGLPEHPTTLEPETGLPSGVPSSSGRQQCCWRQLKPVHRIGVSPDRPDHRRARACRVRQDDDAAHGCGNTGHATRAGPGAVGRGGTGDAAGCRHREPDPSAVPDALRRPVRYRAAGARSANVCRHGVRRGRGIDDRSGGHGGAFPHCAGAGCGAGRSGRRFETASGRGCGPALPGAAAGGGGWRRR